MIYADETEVKLKKTKGYVVVLSNTEEVLYLYRSSREVDFLSELLEGGLLGFFLSSERDIDKYRKLGRRKKKPFSLDVLPNRFYEPWRSDFDTTKPSRSGLEDQTDR